MYRFRPLGLMFLLSLLVLGLTACSEKSMTGPDTAEGDEKRGPQLYGLEIDPDYLQLMLNASNSANWNTVSITVELSGDSQTVIPPGWPASRPFQVKIEDNTLRSGRYTFRIKYMTTAPWSNTVPRLPRNATLYQFLDMPPLTYGLVLSMPPAPWYNETLFKAGVWSYSVARAPSGELYAANLSINYGVQAGGSTTFYIPMSEPNRPIPLIMILNPESDIPPRDEAD